MGDCIMLGILPLPWLTWQQPPSAADQRQWPVLLPPSQDRDASRVPEVTASWSHTRVDCLAHLTCNEHETNSVHDLHPFGLLGQFLLNNNSG